MPRMTEIVDKTFLEWLQLQLTNLLGKMSVVFEDVNGEPIGAIRMFAPAVEAEGKKNLCKLVIDCDENLSGKKACRESDAGASSIAASNLKTCLYRCQRGKGFVNLAIPIRIWGNIVVGNLYAGQCILRVPQKERQKFISTLQEHKFFVPEGQTLEDIVNPLTDDQIYNFYDSVVPLDLQKRFVFNVFKDEFRKQEANGMSGEEFINAFELLEKLANYLSELGNELYTMKSFVDLRRRLSPSLVAECNHLLTGLEEEIAHLILNRKEELPENERMRAVEAVHKSSLDISILLKDYETDYTLGLLRPYLEHVIPQTEKSKQLALQFFFLRAFFEVQRYPKIRAVAQRWYMDTELSKGDQLWNRFLELSKQMGEYQGAARNLLVGQIIKLYKDSPFLLQTTQLVSILMHVYGNDKEPIKKVLDDHGIYRIVAQDLQEAKEGKVSQYRTPLHLILRETEEIWRNMRQINENVLTKSNEAIKPDIEEVRKYIDKITRLRNTMTSLLTFSPEFPWSAENRKQVDLRFDKIFLNSGGLGPTHRAVLQAQECWLASRNERGPVGFALEEELASKRAETRESLARLIGSKSPNDVLFTNSTTSGIEFVLNSIRFNPNDEVLITDAEHDTIDILTGFLNKKYSVLVEVAKIQDVNDDELVTKRIVEKITPRTRLVIVSHVTYSTGKVIPIKSVIKGCRNKFKGIGNSSERHLILVDGAQAVGSIHVSVGELNCDFYAFDGHKWMLGPEGSGALYIKDFLKKTQSKDFVFPINTAFMVSDECARALKLGNREGNELATSDTAKILGLGAAVKVLNTLKLENIRKRKRSLVGRFLDGVKGNRFLFVMNSRDASKTGIVCLKIKGLEKPDDYYDIVKRLQGLNIFVRTINRPPCLRVSLHYFNSESDVDVLLGSFRLLIEGTNIHRASQNLVKVDIRELVKQALSRKKKEDPAGMLIYGPRGTGKTLVIEEVLDKLKEEKAIRSWVKITPSGLFQKKSSAPSEFARILEQARKNAPYCVFIEEADAVLMEPKKGSRNYDLYKATSKVLNSALDEILVGNEKVCFIGAVNEIRNVSKDIKNRRFYTAYFPLPSFETRMEYLRKKIEQSRLKRDIDVDRIAEATDWFSMKDMERLWHTATNAKKDQLVEQHDFEEALVHVKPTTTPDEIKEFDDTISHEGSIVLSRLKQVDGVASQRRVP